MIGGKRSVSGASSCRRLGHEASNPARIASKVLPRP